MRTMEKFVKDVTPGCAAGIAQTIVGHPLDTIKVKYINSSNKTIMQCIQSMFRDNGVRAFYQGIKSPLYGGLLYNTSVFYGYNIATKSFIKIDNHIMNAAVSGCLVGSCATIVESPMDMLKTRMQLDKRLTFGDTLKMPMQQIFRGSTVTLCRNVPGMAFYFGVFEYSQSLMPNYPLLGSAVSGALAGGACWGFAYPLDNLKTRVQADHLGQKYSGAMDCFRKTPFKMLWSGFVPCMIRAMPVNSAVFFGYTLVAQRF